jgi:hypothetical protein
MAGIIPGNAFLQMLRLRSPYRIIPLNAATEASFFEEVFNKTLCSTIKRGLSNYFAIYFLNKKKQQLQITMKSMRIALHT